MIFSLLHITSSTNEIRNRLITPMNISYFQYDTNKESQRRYQLTGRDLSSRRIRLQLRDNEPSKLPINGLKQTLVLRIFDESQDIVRLRAGFSMFHVSGCSQLFLNFNVLGY